MAVGGHSIAESERRWFPLKKAARAARAEKNANRMMTGSQLLGAIFFGLLSYPKSYDYREVVSWYLEKVGKNGKMEVKRE